MSTPTPEAVAMNLGQKLFGHRFIEDLGYHEAGEGGEDAYDRWQALAAALRDAERAGAEAMRAGARAAAAADLLEQPGVIAPADMRFDNGSSERAARRIEARIAALPLPGDPAPVSGHSRQ